MAQLSFDQWLHSITPELERDEGAKVSAESMAFLRHLFETRGALDQAETERLYIEAVLSFAEQAIEALKRDVARTGGQWDPATRVEIGPQGGFVFRSSSVGQSILGSVDRARALVEIADWVSEAQMEEMWGPWPVCPEHDLGLHPRLSEGKAAWRCTSGHTVAGIGELGA